MSDDTTSQVPRWGFCGTCTLWRYSDRWFASDGSDAPDAATPRCPRCGDEPSPFEQVDADGTGRVLLVLELPPGAEIPLLS